MESNVSGVDHERTKENREKGGRGDISSLPRLRMEINLRRNRNVFLVCTPKKDCQTQHMIAKIASFV